MENNWEDVSEYSQGESRIPKKFRLSTNACDIIIHKHRDYPADHWLVSCWTLSVEKKHLDSKNLEKAKLQALSIIDKRLEIYSSARELVKEEIKKLNDAILGDLAC